MKRSLVSNCANFGTIACMQNTDTLIICKDLYPSPTARETIILG